MLMNAVRTPRYLVGSDIDNMPRILITLDSRAGRDAEHIYTTNQPFRRGEQAGPDRFTYPIHELYE